MRRMLAPGLMALAIIAISLHGSFVRAQANDQESEKAAVDRAYRAYGEAFSRGDLSTVVQHCNAPFVAILPQEVRVLPTAADVEKFFGAARQDLKERGYSHSELLEVHVRLLGATVRSSVPFSQDTKLTVPCWRRSGPHMCSAKLTVSGK